MFFGGVTWHDLKAGESFANHWSGFGKRSSSRGSDAMVWCQRLKTRLRKGSRNTKFRRSRAKKIVMEYILEEEKRFARSE